MRGTVGVNVRGVAFVAGGFFRLAGADSERDCKSQTDCDELFHVVVVFDWVVGVLRCSVGSMPCSSKPLTICIFSIFCLNAHAAQHQDELQELLLRLREFPHGEFFRPRRLSSLTPLV